MSAKNNPLEHLHTLFGIVIVRVLQALLALVIVVAVAELGVLIYGAIARNFFGAPAVVGKVVSTVPDLQRAVQGAFAGVLLVILGLELMETLRTYFAEHRVRLRVIVVVALIAMGRHIIQLDFEHASGVLLIGVGVLVLALATSYYLIGRVSESTEGPADVRER